MTLSCPTSAVWGGRNVILETVWVTPRPMHMTLPHNIQQDSNDDSFLAGSSLTPQVVALSCAGRSVPRFPRYWGARTTVDTETLDTQKRPLNHQRAFFFPVQNTRCSVALIYSYFSIFCLFCGLGCINSNGPTVTFIFCRSILDLGAISQHHGFTVSPVGQNQDFD